MMFDKVTGFAASLALVVLLIPISALSEEWQISGYFDLEYRYFNEPPFDSRQHDHYLAIGSEAEFYRQWKGSEDALTLTPFVRISQHDSERNHLDFREANWLHIDENWEVRVGLGKVFWGVTESQHLVDIVNQTDNLEGPDGEDKLGQPMVNLIISRDWGDLSFFWLPYFRERQFPGNEGRLRAHPKIDADFSSFESGAKQTHQDFALRWSYTLGDLDLAVSRFQGTSREPTLIARKDNQSNDIFAPFYEQIEQTGLELSWVQGSWLWKMEAIHRSGLANNLGQDESYNALVGGFEYTSVGIAETDIDLGVLIEYHYDDRYERATTPFQDDTFLGLRLTLNDVESTEFLAGVIVDNDSSGSISFVEASTRIGERIKLTFEARFFEDLSSSNPLRVMVEDDHLLLNLAYYF